MKTKHNVLDMATDIANIPGVDVALAYRLRRLILRVAKTAIEAQQNDPSTLKSIENWIET